MPGGKRGSKSFRPRRGARRGSRGQGRGGTIARYERGTNRASSTVPAYDRVPRAIGNTASLRISRAVPLLPFTPVTGTIYGYATSLNTHVTNNVDIAGLVMAFRRFRIAHVAWRLFPTVVVNTVDENSVVPSDTHYYPPNAVVAYSNRWPHSANHWQPTTMSEMLALPHKWVRGTRNVVLSFVPAWMEGIAFASNNPTAPSSGSLVGFDVADRWLPTWDVQQGAVNAQTWGVGYIWWQPTGGTFDQTYNGELVVDFEFADEYPSPLTATPSAPEAVVVKFDVEPSYVTPASSYIPPTPLGECDVHSISSLEELHI